MIWIKTRRTFFRSSTHERNGRAEGRFRRQGCRRTGTPSVRRAHDHSRQRHSRARQRAVPRHSERQVSEVSHQRPAGRPQTKRGAFSPPGCGCCGRRRETRAYSGSPSSSGCVCCRCCCCCGCGTGSVGGGGGSGTPSASFASSRHCIARAVSCSASSKCPLLRASRANARNRSACWRNRSEVVIASLVLSAAERNATLRGKARGKTNWKQPGRRHSAGQIHVSRRAQS